MREVSCRTVTTLSSYARLHTRDSIRPALVDAGCLWGGHASIPNQSRRPVDLPREITQRALGDPTIGDLLKDHHGTVGPPCTAVVRPSGTQLGRSPEGPSRLLCTLHETRTHIGTPLAKLGRRVAKPSVRARQSSPRHPKRGLQLPIIPPPRTPDWQTSTTRSCQPGVPEEDCKTASWAWRQKSWEEGCRATPRLSGV